MKDIYHRAAQRGFTLIEMMTVLVIVGLLLAAFTAFFKNYELEQRRKTTESNVKTALNAIESYRALNGRYPRPARLSVDGANLPDTGVEQPFEIVGAQTAPGDCRNDADGRTLYCVQVASAARIGGADFGINTHKPLSTLADTAGRVLIGAIPFRSIDLNESKTYDGYGSRLYYAVTEDLTQIATFHNLNGAIKLVDNAGRELTEPKESGRYVVFSVGKNQAGGWTRDGLITNSCDPDVDGAGAITGYNGADRENCDFLYRTVYNENDVPLLDAARTATFRVASNSAGGGVNTEDDLVMFDYDLGSQSTGEWRRGTAASGVQTTDLVMSFRRVLVGSNTGKALTAFHIQGTGDLRVGEKGKIIASNFCDTETGAGCFKVSELVRKCPDGEYMVGFGRKPDGTYQQDGADNTLVLCSKMTIGCPASGNVVLKGIGKDGKPNCVPNMGAFNQNVAAAAAAAAAAQAAANVGNAVAAAAAAGQAAAAARAAGVIAGAPGNAGLAGQAAAAANNAAAALAQLLIAINGALAGDPGNALLIAAQGAVVGAVGALDAANLNPGNAGLAAAARNAINAAIAAVNAAFGVAPAAGPPAACVNGEERTDPLESCTTVFSGADGNPNLVNLPGGTVRDISRKFRRNCALAAGNDWVLSGYSAPPLTQCCNKPDITYPYRVITCTVGGNCTVDMISQGGVPVLANQDTSSGSAQDPSAPTAAQLSTKLWGIFKTNFTNLTSPGGCGQYAKGGKIVQQSSISNCVVTWKTISTEPVGGQSTSCTCNEANVCRTNKSDMPAGTPPTIVEATAGSNLGEDEKKSCATIHAATPDKYRTGTCRSVTRASTAAVPTTVPNDNIQRCQTLNTPTAHADGVCVEESFSWKKGPYLTGQTFPSAPGNVVGGRCTYAERGSKGPCTSFEGGVYVGYRECECRPSQANCTDHNATICPW